MLQSTSSEFQRHQTQRVVSVATDMLSGRLSFLEGARLLSHLRVALRLPVDDPDFLPFVATDSETDHLPLGGVRRFWSAEALARLQSEIQSAESNARTSCTHAAQALISRFGV